MPKEDSCASAISLYIQIGRVDFMLTKADWAKRLVLISAAMGCALVFGLGQTGAAPDFYSDFFKDKVQPILEQNCVSCHGAKIQR